MIENIAEAHARSIGIREPFTSHQMVIEYGDEDILSYIVEDRYTGEVRKLSVMITEDLILSSMLLDLASL